MQAKSRPQIFKTPTIQTSLTTSEKKTKTSVEWTVPDKEKNFSQTANTERAKAFLETHDGRSQNSSQSTDRSTKYPGDYKEVQHHQHTEAKNIAKDKQNHTS